jgi:Flp pilus assembly protein TadG
MIRRRAHRRDAGVAAVEFALIFGLLLSLLALVFPLGELLLQKMALDRAMSDVIRYATTTADSPEPTANGTPGTTRRPDCAQIDQEVASAYGNNAVPSDFSQISIYGATAGNTPTNICPIGPDGLASGGTVAITVSKTVNLGPLGDLLSIAGITHNSSVTVTAAASGREE